MTDRPMTPFRPFEDAPRSITPAAGIPAVTPTPPSARPSTFTREVHDAIALAEQSIVENVKRAIQSLGTLLIERQHEARATQNARLDAHAAELRTLRGALERAGTILPPPPDGM